MEAISCISACVSLAGNVVTASIKLTRFIHDVRHARKDLDSVATELHSLNLILELLKEDISQSEVQEYTLQSAHQEDISQSDARPFSESLLRQISAILIALEEVVGGISKLLDDLSTSHIGQRVKWTLIEKDNANTLRTRLEAHKSLLGIALDMLGL
jgi:hypothetical protein